MMLDQLQLAVSDLCLLHFLVTAATQPSTTAYLQITGFTHHLIAIKGEILCTSTAILRQVE